MHAGWESEKCRAQFFTTIHDRLAATSCTFLPIDQKARVQQLATASKLVKNREKVAGF
jgi:hypothetical protein